MDENKMSDEELMALYQAGEIKAFEALYSRHSGRVYQFLKTKCAPEGAKELLQDVFFKVHRSRAQYSPQYPFLPWLFTITRNAVIDLARLNETKVSKKSSADAGKLDLVSMSDEEWTPDLSQALQTLPAQQRRAIELRYLSEWTFEQIAKDMKTTPINVRQVISRGIKKLRSGFGGGK